jgi:hypothetical protein
LFNSTPGFISSIILSGGSWTAWYDFVSILTPENVDWQLKSIMEFYNTTSAWDMSSWQSALDIFMPFAMFGAFTGIGLWRYKWTVR